MTSATRVKRHRDRAKSGLVHFTRWIPADKVGAMSAAYEAICNSVQQKAIADVAARMQAFDELVKLLSDAP
jgi:hypothetical protein